MQGKDDGGDEDNEEHPKTGGAKPKVRLSSTADSSRAHFKHHSDIQPVISLSSLHAVGAAAAHQEAAHDNQAGTGTS